MKTVYSSETLVDICQDTLRCIPEDSTHQQKLGMLMEIMGLPHRSCLRTADAFHLPTASEMPLDRTPYFHIRNYCLRNSHAIVRDGAELR
jgi:hypothetical protein